MKKYYSHVLFSNTSDWNKKNLKDIAIIKMGFTPSTKKEEYWNGNIKWLAVSDMGSKYISKTKKHITKIAIGKKEIIKKDTLVMSFKLTIGKLGILKEDMYSNEAICNFQWKNKNINTEFMYYYLSSINLKKYGSQAAKGITLNKETLNMIPIRIPSYETQINIVNILSNIDIKLEYLSKKINYEKRYKKGLLQKMFV
ncbi:restriction endonuclease subunit S [uncultured Methanosphaera sp.]|uniref:restriction endonuclease subunit S n=1 Tax=uncultured Methanosphaera sp. TaxID=262501 RepID=UPI00259A5B5E|nr:restriction endonuclease subunit S [uncultured Methanosphaera sp.]